MTRALRIALPRVLVAVIAAGPIVAGADEQPSALPGQPGGDPKPDTAEAANYLKQRRYEDAITSSKRALQRDERYVPAMMIMARSYFHLKKYELSSAIIDLVRQLEPNNAEAYNLLGFIALARDDQTTATANFKKATELKDDFGNAWNNLAAQYLLSKSYDAAVEAAEKAVRYLPNYEKAHLNLGSAYRGKGRNEEAERAYRRALELKADYPEAYFNLGILYLDAPQMPNMDLITRLNTAIGFLARYKNVASYRLTKDDPADAFVEDARKQIDREQKRLERERKKKEREAAKKPPPPAAAPAAPATGTPPGPGGPAEGAPPLAPGAAPPSGGGP